MVGKKSKADADVPVDFDPAALARHTMDDAQLQQEVLALFTSQVVAIGARLAAGDLTADEAKFMAHSLRGAAAAVGALRIQQLAEKWQENPSQLSEIKEKLGLAAKEFLAAIRK